MLFVTNQERDRRLKICQACKYFKEDTKSCGTILRPRTLRNGVYLCGCHMPTKTRFKAAKCGAGNWNEHITEEDLNELRKFAGLSGTITAEQVKEMTDAYNRVMGVNTRYTSCPSCIRQMHQRIQEMITHDHNEEVLERSKLIALKKKHSESLDK